MAAQQLADMDLFVKALTEDLYRVFERRYIPVMFPTDCFYKSDKDAAKGAPERQLSIRDGEVGDAYVVVGKVNTYFHSCLRRDVEVVFDRPLIVSRRKNRVSCLHIKSFRSGCITLECYEGPDWENSIYIWVNIDNNDRIINISEPSQDKALIAEIDASPYFKVVPTQTADGGTILKPVPVATIEETGFGDGYPVDCGRCKQKLDVLYYNHPKLRQIQMIGCLNCQRYYDPTHPGGWTSMSEMYPTYVRRSARLKYKAGHSESNAGIRWYRMGTTDDLSECDGNGRQFREATADEADYDDPIWKNYEVSCRTRRCQWPYRNIRLVVYC